MGTTRRVGFLVPMPSEMKPLVKAASLRRVAGEGPRTYRGVVGETEVVAVQTGIGTALAGQVTEHLLAHHDVEHVIVIGIAGTVGDHGIRALVIPETVIDGASGREYTPAPMKPVASEGKLHTSDEFILDPARLAALAERGVTALDMETSAIAEVCERNGMPWSVFRAISDSAADQPLGDNAIKVVNQDGSPNLRAVAKLVARHPSSVRHLAALGRDATAAARTAALAGLSQLP